MNDIKKTNLKRWPYMAVGFGVFLFVGLIYGWPIFAPVFGAEFKSWNSAALALTFTISMSCFCVGNMLGGMIVKRTSVRIATIISAACILAGFIATTRVQESSIWVLYVSYGVVCGFGVGLMYNIVLNVATKWYPDKVGTVSGTLMMGFALSTLLLGTGASYMIGIYGWRTVFIVLGIITAAILVIASFLLALPGQDVILPQKPVPASGKHDAAADMTVGQMVKSLPFWLFMVWGLFMLVSVYSLMGNTKQVALDIGASASVATLSVAVVSLSNGLGRFILGSAYDKFGRKLVMTIDSLLLLASAIVIIAAFKTGSSSVMMIGFILTGLAYGGVPPMSSAFVVDFFGGKNYAGKFGIISFYILFGSIGSFLAGVIKTQSGTFETVFYVLIGLEIAAVLLNLGIKKKAAVSAASPAKLPETSVSAVKA
ncbi:MAG: OFA family MFS transporter [Clostridiales bacterium]|nr:OFA family MFS transporter [Clostridiales bacterium]